MRSIGHPLLGDTKYETTQSIAATAKLQIDFLALHAWKLSFKTLKGKVVHVQCEPQKNFVALLKKLKIAIPKSA